MIVRTIDDSDIERLRAAGATEVVPEAIEGSLMLASHALALVGVPMRRVLRRVQDQRDARYGLLARLLPRRRRRHRRRAAACPAAERDPAAGGREPRPDARRAGAAGGPGSASSRCAGASSAVLQPEDGLRLAAGDTLVLSGLPEPLALAEEKLLRAR